MTKTKQRRGIGWSGRVFEYGTANGPTARPPGYSWSEYQPRRKHTHVEQAV